MFDFSFLYKYLGFDSPKLIFLTYLFIEICVITTIYYFQYRFCKINFESNFLKFCQLVINSIYLPMMLFITVNVICDRNNFFLQYVDDYFINIINNFKRISFVWMCWLGFAKFITNVEKTLIARREETNKSFVEFECDYAVRHNLPIIVLYNSLRVDKSKCIDSVINLAKCHVPMGMRKLDGTLDWDYQGIKAAFDKLG